jgi:hypothetical protein
LSAKKRRFLAKSGVFLLEYVRDACLLAGFLMVGYGLWRIYHPAAWVICGAMVLWVGLPPRKRRRE